MKFKEKIARFMYGRYGADQLSNFILWVYIALFAVNLFANSLILYLSAIALMIWTFFRMFSRNIGARNKENLKFLAMKKKFTSFWKLLFDCIKDSPKKVYKRCPSCRAVVRLPRKAGKHSATCPKCRKSFSLRIMPFWAIVLITALAVLAILASVVLILI